MNRIKTAAVLGVMLLAAVCITFFFVNKDDNEKEVQAGNFEAVLPWEPSEDDEPSKNTKDDTKDKTEITAQQENEKLSEKEQLPEKQADTVYDSKTNPITLKDDIITEVYSLDGDGYRYHPVTKERVVKKLAEILESYEPEYNPSAPVDGFLIFTEKGKHACYLDAERLDVDAMYAQLVELSERCNAGAAGGAQWLVYMTPSNLSRLTFSGLAGDGYCLSYQEDTFVVDVQITEREQLENASAFLKNLNVRPGELLKGDEKVVPQDKYSLWTIKLEFSTGVSYDVFGYRDELYISSSDMDGQLHYLCNDLEILRLRDYMLMHDEARVKLDNQETEHD